MTNELQKLNVTQLRYVNIQRSIGNTVTTSPPKLPSGMLLRRRPTKIAVLTGDSRANPDPQQPTSANNENEPIQHTFDINVPGEENWVFTGFLADPRLLHLMNTLSVQTKEILHVQKKMSFS